MSVIFDCGMSDYSDPERVKNPISNSIAPQLGGGDGKENTPIKETVAVAEIPPSTSVHSIPPAPLSPALVVPRLEHEVSMPVVTVSAGGSKLDGPCPNTTEHEVSTRGAINNYDQHAYIDRTAVRYTAYRTSLQEIEHETGVSLDNFPVCERVEIKDYGSNTNRLVLPIKRYLSALHTYLMQWKPMYGSPGLLCLLNISNDTAEQPTYNIRHVAEVGG